MIIFVHNVASYLSNQIDELEEVMTCSHSNPHLIIYIHENGNDIRGEDEIDGGSDWMMMIMIINMIIKKSSYR